MFQKSAQKNDKVKLKKSLNFPLLLFYSTGTILGLGIYVLMGKIVGEAGTLAPFSFLVAFFIAIFSAFSYSELSARIPKSGGAVNYVDAAFHRDWFSQIIGWLLVTSAIISTATVLNGYVGYVHVFANIPAWIIISAMILILSGVAAWGITQSAATITGITIIELIGIFLVIILGAENLTQLPARLSEFVPSWDFGVWKGIFVGAFLCFFTFIGFEDVVNVAEESKNPQKDMPKAIIGSLVILTVLYIIVSVVSILGLSASELKSSTAPLADVLAKKNSSYPLIISAIGLIAVINGVMVQIVMNSRVLYGMARKRLAPKIFARLNPKTRTPVVAIGFSGLIILVLALLFDLESLAKATNYILLLVFTAVNLSLWVIKKRQPKVKGVRTYPIFVPIIGFFSSLAILLFQIYSGFFG